MKRRPRMVDLCCKAGGASMGYHRAGFDVIGLDLEPQPRYPFEFHRADIRTLSVADLLSLGPDVIAASPPCKVHTAMKGLAHKHHLNLIPETRALCMGSGLPYVIENVPGAPLTDPLMLCGSTFGLGVQRHRLFELGRFKLEQPDCDHAGQAERSRGYWVARYHNGVKRLNWSPVVGVYGGGQGLGPGEVPMWREAMGIDWMVRDELSQAIPPAYTEWIGVRLLAHLADTGGHGVANLRDHPRDGSCSHWDPLAGYCRTRETRRYLIGPRCRLDAPGATAEHCAHRVPWGRACQACLDIWSTEGTVKAST